MSDLEHAELVLEPERYELFEAGPYRFEIDRREFFKTVGCGMIVLFVTNAALAQQETGGGGGLHA